MALREFKAPVSYEKQQSTLPQRGVRADSC